MHVQKQSSDVIAHQWRLESAELICHLGILGDIMSMLLFKGLRLVMWSLLHNTDQPAVPQALVSAKHFPRLICVVQQLTESPVSNPIIICFTRK